MKHRFVHEFEDDPPLGDFDVELDAPPEARIRFDLGGGSRSLWLTANRAGWRHLARVCAEMALQSHLSPGFHFHRSVCWGASVDGEGEVTFAMADDEASAEGGEAVTPEP